MIYFDPHVHCVRLLMRAHRISETQLLSATAFEFSLAERWIVRGVYPLLSTLEMQIERGIRAQMDSVQGG